MSFTFFSIFGGTENGRSWPLLAGLGQSWPILADPEDKKNFGKFIRLYFFLDRPGPAKTGQNRPFSVTPKIFRKRPISFSSNDLLSMENSAVYIFYNKIFSNLL